MLDRDASQNTDLPPALGRQKQQSSEFEASLAYSEFVSLFGARLYCASVGDTEAEGAEYRLSNPSLGN